MIESISIYRLELPLTVPYKLAFGDVHNFDTILTVVKGENQQIGFGEATILTGYTDETIEDSWLLSKELGRRLKSCQPSEVDQILFPYLTKAPFTVTAFLTAIEMLRSPEQYQLSGDIKVPILGILNGATSAEIIGESENLLSRGFSTIKVKVGFDVQKDLKKVEDAQSAISGRALIRLDGNQGFSREQACDFIGGLNPMGIELFEQPCAAGDWASAAYAAEISPVPMMLDESIYGLDDIEKAKQLNAAKYIKVKLMKFGSMEKLINSISFIKKMGMKAVLGNGVATDVGCWMEALIASKHIDNAGEMNGFLKPRESILINPLIFKDGAIDLHRNYMPLLNMDVIDKFSVGLIEFKNAKTVG